MKKILVLSVLACSLLVGCGKSQMQQLEETYYSQGFDGAMDYLKSVQDENTLDENIELLNRLTKLEFGVNASDLTKLSTQKPTPKNDTSVLKITDIGVSNKKLNIEVENTGTETIRYFKYDVYFKDANGNVLDSDWGNSSKTILPNAKATDETYIDIPSGTESYSVAVTEVSFK